ncbi:phosphotransferase enzyme family protein [Paenibacillus tengchongensis]|uniref:phosphotransferase enzyme family protein n=1 Tax=Paenibacillus tengchongensis TaxID=2608684 RepID=UPI001652B3E7|nr:phosphotransferase [Paenibacillus tengchongensis]
MPQYSLAWDKLVFIGYSDSATFKVETASTGSYLLRVHSEGTRTAELASELQLLDTLSRTLPYPVPTGLAAASGEYIVHSGEAGLSLPPVTVTHWVEGNLLEDDLSELQAAELGRMAGELHQAAACFAPPAGFTRPRWGADSFKLEMERLKRHYPSFLSEREWLDYQAAAAKILRQFASLKPAGEGYGLIHGDLHSGNIIDDGRQLLPIDFGRCGYGYYLYDLAAMLLGLTPCQRKLCIDGYASVRPLPENAVAQLECFFVMVMLGNYSHHADNPEEISGLREEQPYALAYLRQFLQGNSFLFERMMPVLPDA